MKILVFLSVRLRSGQAVPFVVKLVICVNPVIQSKKAYPKLQKLDIL